MDTQDAVEKFRQEAAQEGGAGARRQSVIDVYELRFGALPAELRSAIEATTDDATLRTWLGIAASSSAEALATAVHASRVS